MAPAPPTNTFHLCFRWCGAPLPSSRWCCPGIHHRVDKHPFGLAVPSQHALLPPSSYRVRWCGAPTWLPHWCCRALWGSACPMHPTFSVMLSQRRCLRLLGSCARWVRDVNLARKPIFGKLKTLAAVRALRVLCLLQCACARDLNGRLCFDLFGHARQGPNKSGAKVIHFFLKVGDLND